MNSPAHEFFKIIQRMVHPLGCTMGTNDDMIIHIHDKTHRGLQDRSLYIEWEDESITIRRKNNNYNPYSIINSDYNMVARHSLFDPDSINKIVEYILLEKSTAINHFIPK